MRVTAQHHRHAAHSTPGRDCQRPGAGDRVESQRRFRCLPSARGRSDLGARRCSPSWAVPAAAAMESPAARRSRSGPFRPLGGLALPQLLAASERAAVAGSAKARSVIVLYLLGGAATQDMYDLKPDAPSEVRSQFKPIPTSVPGIQVCEHLPQMARWMHSAAIIRSLNHKAGCHNTLPSYTGYEVALSRHHQHQGQLSAQHGLGLRVAAGQRASAATRRRRACPTMSTCPAISAGARTFAAPGRTAASSASGSIR